MSRYSSPYYDEEGPLVDFDEKHAELDIIHEEDYQELAWYPKRLLNYHEIPGWQRDNDYILSGYRPVSRTRWAAVKSHAHLNNESINVLTHLYGGLLFVMFPVWFYLRVYPSYPHADTVDLVSFAVFLASAALCFLLSAGQHIFSNTAERVAARWSQMDYAGLITLAWGSAMPSIYYGFYCEPTLQRVYWLVMTAMAAGATELTLNRSFAHANFRPVRAVMYALVVLTFGVCVAHGVALNGWAAQSAMMGLAWMKWAALWNLFGIVCFAARIPERWVPFTFDIFGSSHQLFHVATLAGALFHFAALLSAFDHIRGDEGVCQAMLA